ncbi:uncharacterized protein ACHE_40326S [Aspergillus chevalieri]|uniref:Uncharacterized protein n=1 Tax=Aspergillus chevalieri TaxID=182096 RepID=A0A7R7VN62_ASPCH|nr:uncharacterized protein ACHE_40326S [Aspergillus chevalieri]BCR87762.1 hypothetical protein ACHE_40326S [Aspergillus chevalieri]
MPGIYPDTPATGLPLGGHINPGETSIQAAARRYHERKRRESASGLDSQFTQPSPAEHLIEEPRRDSRDSRNSTGSAEMPRRRSSLSERWNEFKRHLP